VEAESFTCMGSADSYVMNSLGSCEVDTLNQCSPGAVRITSLICVKQF